METFWYGLDLGEWMESFGESPSAIEDRGPRLVAFYQDRPQRRNSVGVQQLVVDRANEYKLRDPVVAKVVYVTQPGDSRSQIPFADYEEQLARDKLNEALRVFNALGASRVVARTRRSSDGRLRVSAKVRGNGPQVSGGRQTAWELAYDQRGSGGRPSDPRPLRYPDEPGFASACDAVLKNGARHVKIEITRSSQFSVNGELAGRLKKCGFDLGLNSSRTRSHEFVIDAAFGDESAAELEEIVAISGSGRVSPAAWVRGLFPGVGD